VRQRDEDEGGRRRGGLGRGLSALIPAGEMGLRDLPVDSIVANPRQPRTVFDPVGLEELAASIADVGLLQPLLVRPAGPGRYELVAGERRLRASQMAGLTRVPAIVRDTADTDLLKEALIENVHRTDLGALEEAAAYQQLLDDFGVSQEELARRLGKSRPAIGNTLRLLGLPPSVQSKLAGGVLTAGHAKAILALPDREQQERLADKVVAEGLSVRRTEELARLGLAGPAPRRRTPAATVTSPGLEQLESRLSDALGARVSVRVGRRKGRLTVEFGTIDDLERIVVVLARGLETDIAVGEQPL